MSVFPAGTIAAVRRDPTARLDPVDRLAALAGALVRQSAPVRFAVARRSERRSSGCGTGS